MRAKGTYTVKKWEENTFVEIPPGQKMTKATVEYEFSGEIEGKGSVEYLMFYRSFDPNDPHKASASYVGLIRFEGRLAGRSGGFVLKDDGTFEAGTAKSSLRIDEGSGSGALTGITGTGSYQANQEGFRIELAYDLP